MVIDIDGNNYIDLHTGFTVNVLGYGNQEVNEAMKAQMDKLAMLGYLLKARQNLPGYST